MELIDRDDQEVNALKFIEIVLIYLTMKYCAVR